MTNNNTMHQTIHSPETKLLSFSRSHKPLITVESGDVVCFDNRNAGFKEIKTNTTTEDLLGMNITGLQDLERVMGPIYVDGPVYVNGAEPGDTLRVDILELQTGDWGWTAVFPGLGLLQDEIPGPLIKTFSLQDRHTIFKPGITLRAQPFYGTMGVAPGSDEELHPLFPRNDIGGNVDCRDLSVGATLFLPVNVAGALFAVGDAHFCQGDGEVTGTALETTMRSQIRLTVVKRNQRGSERKPIVSPHYETSASSIARAHEVASRGEHGVMATAATHDEAVKTALRGLLEWLAEEKGLSKGEGYMLFSLVGNLKKMHDLGLQIHTVSAGIPLSIFDEV